IERERDIRGACHRVGRPARGARGRLHARKLLGEELDVGARGEPRVEARRLAQGCRPAAADPDGRASGLLRLRLHRDVLEREVLAAEADVIAAPQRPTDLERLEEPADAALERNTRRRELSADGRIVGGEAHPEDDPAFGRASSSRNTAPYWKP